MFIIMPPVAPTVCSSIFSPYFLCPAQLCGSLRTRLDIHMGIMAFRGGHFDLVSEPDSLIRCALLQQEVSSLGDMTQQLVRFNPLGTLAVSGTSCTAAAAVSCHSSCTHILGSLLQLEKNPRAYNEMKDNLSFNSY